MTTDAQYLFNVDGVQMAAAFTEWDRRYREDPDRFDSDFKRILRGQTPEDYGSACVPYLHEILCDLDPESQIAQT